MKLGAVLGMIREALKSRVFYATEMAREVSEKMGMEEDDAKLMVNDCCRQLVQGGEARRMRFEREDGTSVVLYYASPEEGQGESTLHQYLVSYVERLLRSGGASTLHVSSSPEPLPDVETSTRYIEVETGLKRRVDDQRSFANWSGSLPSYQSSRRLFHVKIAEGLDFLRGWRGPYMQFFCSCT